MTVFVYVNTARQVGDADHIKVFQDGGCREKWSRRTPRRASLSNTT